MREFDPEWSPPRYEMFDRAMIRCLGRGDDISIGESAGRTRIHSDWRPFRPGTRLPYFPAIEGYTLLGVGEFACPNDVEGEKRFSCAVYRCDAFVNALLKAGKLADEPTAIFEPGNTEANARAAVDCEFVLLPPIGHAGQFVMGSPETEIGRFDDEGPQQQVQITRQFLMARTACTQRLWQAVMGSNPAYFQDGENGTPADSSMLPVEKVSWDDICGAEGFHARAGVNGLRLPSEAEWEFACRAGTATAFCFGSGKTVTSKIVNFDGNNPYGGGPKSEYRQRTVEVGSLPMNAFGLFEVHGNVWEWCADAWVDTLDGIPIDGTVRENTGASHRVIRGGGWNNNAVYCRSAYRNWITPGIRYRRLGFRLAQSVEPEAH